ncbi:MAG: heparin lyase I family protein [Acidobacteria bacterium]|nr:heparin lyase I family protein [Acidobacteriota bacterium]
MERTMKVVRALGLGIVSFTVTMLSPIPSVAQVTVTADGPGNTYELLEARGFGLETPDCGHAVRHIREVFDSTLNKNVFAFDIHRDLDDDRCTNFDRQRLEVKTAPGDANQDILQHTNGQTAYYRWKFKLPSGFQPSPNFTHIFQIKAQAGSDAGSPLVTITPRAGSPDIMQIIWTPPSGQSGGGVKAQADLSLFRNVWVEAFVQYRSADSGSVQLSIKRLSDGITLISWNSGTVDTWRAGNNYNRGKWGIYRSLNSISSLRDETVLFADWCVSETSAGQCPSAVGTGGGAVRIQAENMAKTLYETNTFEGETCARATSNSVGNIRATFNGTTGTHDITVRYHDENDGQVTFTLLVGGIVVGSWTANVDDHTWKTRTFTGIFIANGALISIEAAREEGEHARVDYVEIR